MNTQALRFEKISRLYGGKTGVQDVSLAVSEGEFFGLVGMNGAGKTTLIKCLFDFCAMDSGRIEIFGADHRRPAARSPIAFLPERFMPPYYLSGRDFLKYMLKLQDVPYEPEAVNDMLHALDLDPLALSRSVRTYSKGMTQKLGLATCFLAQKKLFVLDEPMSGLDPKARALLKEQLQQVRKAGGTLFFSSHALADVEEICDRMAILHAGQLRFVGTPAQCRQQYGVATLEQAFIQSIA